MPMQKVWNDVVGNANSAPDLVVWSKKEANLTLRHRCFLLFFFNVLHLCLHVLVVCYLFFEIVFLSVCLSLSIYHFVEYSAFLSTCRDLCFFISFIYMVLSYLVYYLCCFVSFCLSLLLMLLVFNFWFFFVIFCVDFAELRIADLKIKYIIKNILLIQLVPEKLFVMQRIVTKCLITNEISFTIIFCPIQFNYFWNLGFFFRINITIQIIPGICLGLHYTSDHNFAFFSLYIL